MKPYISIIIPTMRLGGLDILFSSLENQTFKDFELILIDSLYSFRKDIVAEKLKNYSFTVKHIAPLHEESFSGSGYCRAMNTGLVNADGHLALFICDYAWLEPNCLQIHAHFHKFQKEDPNTALFCSYKYVKLPQLHKDINNNYAHTVPYDTVENKKLFVETEQKCFNDYVSDINSGKLNNVFWSVFETPFNTSENIDNLELELDNSKKGIEEGIIGKEHCVLKNESYVLETLLKINGFNEALDESHGWQDSEFIDRLTTLEKTKLYFKPNLSIVVINPRTIINGRIRQRDVFSNERIWQSFKLNEFKNPVNNWSLKDNKVVYIPPFKKLKIAFLFGAWSIGNRPLNFSELMSSARGLTGSESGICLVAKEMATMGHDVYLYTVYTDVDTTMWENVKIRPVNNVQEIDSSFDTVISWSEADLLRYVAQDNLAANTVRICYTMLNDWHFSQPGFTNVTDYLVTVCDMLKDRLIANMEPHDYSKWSVIPLGCIPELYSDERVKGRVIFTSSVDRGLHWLLSQWPKIKSAVPEAHLRIFYHFSYGNILAIEPDDPNAHFHIKEMGNRLRYILHCISKMKHLGVEHVGSVSVDQMTKEYNEASVFAFSTDCIAFSEGFSCSTLQSLASFTVPVITSADCLGEIYKDSGAIVVDAPVRDNLDKFTEQIIKSLTDQKYADDVINKCRGFAEKHTWKNTAEQLINIVLKSPKLKNKER